LTAGLPLEVAATTVDSQCGSSQQATGLAAALVRSGVVDVALSCGVESMSRVPLGATVRTDFGRPYSPTYQDHYELTSQFEGAERIAEKWGVTRDDCDRFGLESQTRAQQAWKEARFEREVLPVAGVTRDEGLRETSLEALAKLKSAARTACTPPARRRRSPTARQQCFSPRRQRRATSACGHVRASSTSAWSASTRS
jgi:acetyl-CoA C-acetyltransferase